MGWCDEADVDGCLAALADVLVDLGVASAAPQPSLTA
jgi:hypothetical protein